MIRLAPALVAVLILAGCAAREDVQACSVVSAKVSETALSELTGDSRIDQLSANAVAALSVGPTTSPTFLSQPTRLPER